MGLFRQYLRRLGRPLVLIQVLTDDEYFGEYFAEYLSH